MEKKSKKGFYVACCLLAAFVLWTLLVRFADVQAIGPQGSSVGLATVNQWVHRLTGVHWTLYMVTDWLGLVPFAVAIGFAVLGLVQWIVRKKLSLVDRSLITLGGFYIAVIAMYVFFEIVVINNRPVLINGCLEASYPSSTTVLVMCIIPTAMMQLGERIKNQTVRRCATVLMTLFLVFMVLGRLISGVHWITDIIGGALISAGLVTMYHWICAS